MLLSYKSIYGGSNFYRKYRPHYPSLLKALRSAVRYIGGGQQAKGGQSCEQGCDAGHCP